MEICISQVFAFVLTSIVNTYLEKNVNVDDIV